VDGISHECGDESKGGIIRMREQESSFGIRGDKKGQGKNSLKFGLGGATVVGGDVI